MKFAVASTTMAYMFDVARELQKRGELAALYSAYPEKKLLARKLQGKEMHSQTWPMVASQVLNRVVRKRSFAQAIEPYPKMIFDKWVSRNLVDADVFFSTSSMGLQAGRAAKKRGMLWVCERPCTHIQEQDRLLTNEYRRLGQTWPGIHPKVIEIELTEYNEADAVVVASPLAKQSFLDRGFDERKIWVIPFGVDLSKFKPSAEPDPNAFEVVYAGQKSLRKGLYTLIDAFNKFEHPNKKLRLIGAPSGETQGRLAAAAGPNIELIESVPQQKLSELMSRASVLVLPSVEDGFGMVTGQALACGCPVIVSDHAGSACLVEERVNGLTFPATNVDALVDSFRWIAEHKDRAALKAASIQSAKVLGDWDTYVDILTENCRKARV